MVLNHVMSTEPTNKTDEDKDYLKPTQLRKRSIIARSIDRVQVKYYIWFASFM